MQNIEWGYLSILLLWQIGVWLTRATIKKNKAVWQSGWFLFVGFVLFIVPLAVVAHFADTHQEEYPNLLRNLFWIVIACKAYFFFRNPMFRQQFCNSLRKP